MHWSRSCHNRDPGRPLEKLSSIRLTNSGGHRSATTTTERSEDVSRSANDSASSRSQHIVGTPTKLVTRSRSMSSSARSASPAMGHDQFGTAYERPQHHRNKSGHMKEGHRQHEGCLSVGGVGVVGGSTSWPT